MARLRTILFAAGFIIAGAGAAAWFALSDPIVSVTYPERGPAVEAVYATGTVEPYLYARIAPKVAGRIIEVRAEEGAAVGAGEVLVRLDDDEQKALVRQLEARVSYWMDETDRVTRLFERGHVSAERRDNAITQLRDAQSALGVAEAKLADFTLRSPVDGTVLREDADPGALARTGEAVVVIGSPRPYRIKAEIDEEDIPLIDPGQRVLIKADAFPGRALEGTVESITPEGDPVARRYRVYIRLPETSPLLVGMTTEVNVLVRQVEDALLVPTAAVEGEGVWAVTDGRLSLVPVTVGIVGSDKTQVVEGLAEDTAVLAEPPGELEAGTAVRTRPADGAAS